jgi:PPOX class probable F420-dependent enzyme
MTDLNDFARISLADRGLCVLATARGDATIQASVINAGVLDHPLTGVPVVGLVARGGTRKLENFRGRPQATIVARSGWEWVAVEGEVDLVGPDDPSSSIDADALRLLLRAVFKAAGGEHDDWDEYDRVMAEDRRTAVLITPTRIYSNG